MISKKVLYIKRKSNKEKHHLNKLLANGIIGKKEYVEIKRAIKDNNISRVD